MLYIGLLLVGVVGYILQRVGDKKHQKVLVIIGWVLMVSIAIASLVCKYGYGI